MYHWAVLLSLVFAAEGDMVKENETASVHSIFTGPPSDVPLWKPNFFMPYQPGNESETVQFRVEASERSRAASQRGFVNKFTPLPML